MILTNELVTLYLTLTTNFCGVLQIPKDEIPTSLADIASFVVGSPNSPLDVQVTGRTGAAFGMRNGMIYYYRSPGSLLHEQNPARFQRYAGPAALTRDGVVQVASNALYRLMKTRDLRIPDRPPPKVRQAEAWKDSPMPFFEITWSRITPNGFPTAAVLEVDARTGRIVYALLLDKVFEDRDFAQKIRAEAYRADEHGDGQSSPENISPTAEPPVSKPQRTLGVPEPSYRGRSLSEWLLQYADRVWGNYERSSTNAGYLAVRRMGTSAIPLLLGWLRHPNAPVSPDVHGDRYMLVRAGFEDPGPPRTRLY